MSRYEEVRGSLLERPRTWLVTGAAGFIGSNLVESLLRLDQRVVGLDNFATGHRRNLDEVRRNVSPGAQFKFIEGDIRNLDVCNEACRDIDVILHQAALGSVPRSIEDPITTNSINVSGFLNMLVAAREARIARFVYAASSSTYGDHPALPKVEDAIGRPLSPYAVTKYVNELYASVFQTTYGLEPIGLRYFNVFGRRQDPDGAYAAVIPKWVDNLLSGRECRINGDGESSRDFCYVENAVQANLLAATAPSSAVAGQVYNVALGDRTTLNRLFDLLRTGLAAYEPSILDVRPVYGEFRRGDVRHSQADITRIRNGLGYEPTHTLEEGLRDALPWYAEFVASGAGAAGV